MMNTTHDGVGGGQGREPEDVRASGLALLFWLLLSLLFWIALILYLYYR